MEPDNEILLIVQYGSIEGFDEPAQMYSKTHVKRPLKNSQNKDLNNNDWLPNEVRKYCRMNTFDLL